MGIDSIPEFYATHLAEGIRSSNRKRIVSLGSGDCTEEVEIAELIVKMGIKDFTFECLEISPHLIERAERHVAERNLTSFFRHTQCDVNQWRPDREICGVMAVHALHHFLNLEGMFEGIRDALSESGRFITHDMIGLFDKFVPKFVKQYAGVRATILEAMGQYREEVDKGTFPGPEHSFNMSPDVLEQLKKSLAE